MEALRAKCYRLERVNSLRRKPEKSIVASPRCSDPSACRISPRPSHLWTVPFPAFRPSSIMLGSSRRGQVAKSASERARGRVEDGRRLRDEHRREEVALAGVRRERDSPRTSGLRRSKYRTDKDITEL